MNAAPSPIEMIFHKQQQLIEAFHGIEHPMMPDIHTLAGQQKLRLTVLFFIEELFEASDALNTLEDSPLEEFADALHFLIELAIFAGVKPAQLEESPASHIISVGGWQDVVLQAGSVVYNLKHKPWKRNPKPTSESNLRVSIIGLYAEFIALVGHYTITQEELFEAYHAKHQKNNERINSNV